MNWILAQMIEAQRNMVAQALRAADQAAEAERLKHTHGNFEASGKNEDIDELLLVPRIEEIVRTPGSHLAVKWVKEGYEDVVSSPTFDKKVSTNIWIPRSWLFERGLMHLARKS